MAGRFEAEVTPQETCEDCGTVLPDDLFGKGGWECACSRYTVVLMDYREYPHRRSDEDKAFHAAITAREKRERDERFAAGYRGPLGL